MRVFKAIVTFPFLLPFIALCLLGNFVFWGMDKAFRIVSRWT